MGSPVKHISECLIKPLHDLSPEAKQPLHFTALDLCSLNLRYSQKGLLFAKPSQLEDQDFSISALLDDLKRSLSATLDHFYPLAARFATRIEENPPSYVIYLDPENIKGVKFIYAKADANVSEILSPLDVPSIVHSFFDLNDAISHDGHTLPLLSIQVTELVDGIFIAGSVNHLVADGSSFWHFMSIWSENFKSKEQYNGSISRPPVIGQSLSPISLPYTHHDQFIDRFEPPPFKERFFHFSSTSISTLKSKANSECTGNYKISSFQAVIALLWRCITRVRRLPPDSRTTCALMINNRHRMNPPLSDDYFGNPAQTVKTSTIVQDLMANGLGWAALQLHKAVINHDDKAVKRTVESWVKNPVIYKMGELHDPKLVHVGSSPRFDMYGCEFGLGKAIAVRSGITNKGNGKITMYPGQEGGGSMDVEVCLSPEYMMDLDRDHELVSAITI